MMWKIWHKLFGWDYIRYEDTATSFICRIITTPNGKKMMAEWSGIYNDILDGKGSFEGCFYGSKYTPLTFQEPDSQIKQPVLKGESE